MLIYNLYDEPPTNIDVINILLDNVSYDNIFYPLLNKTVEVYNCLHQEENGELYYVTNSVGTSKIAKILKDGEDCIISYSIAKEFVTNRAEKLKRILFE